MPTPKKGLVTLTMPRSGSTWLSSLTNATNQMGLADEWLDFKYLTRPFGPRGRPPLYARTLRSGSTENGHFAVKLFPRHLLQVMDGYQMDFIRKCCREHEVKIILLTRKDRVAQAISLVRAMQTGKWKSSRTAQSSRFQQRPRYNFGAVSQAAFHIGRGYDFWRSYLALGDMPYEEFNYESLIDDTVPYFNAVNRHFGLALPAPPKSDLVVQRDHITDEWRSRFLEDVKTFGIPASTFSPKQPAKTPLNALRLLLGRPVKIDRFGYNAFA